MLDQYSYKKIGVDYKGHAGPGVPWVFAATNLSRTFEASKRQFNLKCTDLDCTIILKYF